MPLSQAPPESSLIHIDAVPSASALAAAHALIESELDSNHETSLHPSLPAPRESSFSPLVLSAHTEISTHGKLSRSLDLSRYELPSSLPTDPQARRTALDHAGASAEYLDARQQNLALLETYGKNAWLIANSGLEDELRSLERELEGARNELADLERERREKQEGVVGEMRGLEEGWKKGVGRMIEVLAAGERVRGEILEGKRGVVG